VGGWHNSLYLWNRGVMKLIETKTLSSGATSIVFTSIPQTFTDLVLQFSLRTNRPNVIDVGTIAANSTSLTRRALRGTGSGGVGGATTFDFSTAAADAGANVFGSGSTYISNYSSTSINKLFSTDTVSEQNGTSADQTMSVSLYASNSAITSLTFTSLNAATFQPGSSISLYGITRA
jgi:hypothetical protein